MDDNDAIVATVKDYWEGWFDGEPDRMERAVHGALAKTGVGTDASGRQNTESMTAEDMIGWTREGEGVARKPADPSFTVTINDVYHEIASVTVHSGIYREYLQLIKTPDGWRIHHALYTRVRDDR